MVKIQPGSSFTCKQSKKKVSGQIFQPVENLCELKLSVLKTLSPNIQIQILHTFVAMHCLNE